MRSDSYSDADRVALSPQPRFRNCPFCGGDESVENAVQEPKVSLARTLGPHGKMTVWVQCACGASGKAFDAGDQHPSISETKAATWWNTRSIVPLIGGLLDHYAGQALVGLLSNGQGPNIPWADDPDNLAIHAHRIAQAMVLFRRE